MRLFLAALALCITVGLVVYAVRDVACAAYAMRVNPPRMKECVAANGQTYSLRTLSEHWRR